MPPPSGPSFAAPIGLITVSPSLRDYMIGRGIPGRANYVRAERRARLELHGRTPPADGHLDARRRRAFPPAQRASKSLLEALAVLRSRNLNVRLRAVGGFETPIYKAEVFGLAERLDLAEAIDWIGFTRNVNRELAKINLFVLPSLFGEGLPMVVLEAMAAGLPVVASRVEGVPEAVVHRETGLLVEPGSVSQLARSIEEIITGGVDYAELSRGARHRHAERFSDTKMAEGVADVYREVLADK